MHYSSPKIYALLTIVFLLVFSSLLNAYDIRSVDVHFSGEGSRQSVNTIEKDGVLYLQLDEFAGLLNLRHYFIDENRKFVIRSGSHAIKLMGDNPFFMIDDQLYQLPLPTLLQDEKVYIPLALFVAVSKDVLPAHIHVSSNNRSIQIQRRLFNITGVQIEERANGTLIRFTTTKKFNEKDVAASFNRGWLNVTFYSGTLDSAKIASEIKEGVVQKIVPIQFETSAQLSFLLDREFKEKQFYFTDNEVVLTLRSTQKIDENVLMSDRKRWVIDRIIIDPGHGGKDPGAIGPTGLKEKDVVLDISKRLKNLLEKNLDVEVLLTREDDSYPKVQERGKYANEKNGKLFISIHANGNENDRVRGHSIWLLGPARSEEALQMAEKENSVIELEEDTEAYNQLKDAIHILNAINQSANLKESQDLASIVDKQFKDLNKFPQYGNGIFQAGFYVLVNAAMPKILVETAHITNKYEERLLKTNSVRQQIAQALYLSIKEFKTKYERGI